MATEMDSRNSQMVAPPAPLSFTPEEQQLAAALQGSADIEMIHSRGFSVHQPSAECPWPPSSSPGSSLQTALSTGRVEVLSGHLAERLLMNRDQSRARGVVVIDQGNGRESSWRHLWWFSALQPSPPCDFYCSQNAQRRKEAFKIPQQASGVT